MKDFEKALKKIIINKNEEIYFEEKRFVYDDFGILEANIWYKKDNLFSQNIGVVYFDFDDEGILYNFAYELTMKYEFIKLLNKELKSRITQKAK